MIIGPSPHRFESGPLLSATRQSPLLKAADQCVMCGMCLPHCPTYQLTRDEAESPRGRIALIQGVASGRLPYSPPLAAHLDHCLVCRACEAVCPSGVRYGEIIDGARALLAERRPPATFWQRLAWRGTGALVGNRRRLYRGARLLRLLQRSGLAGLARRLGGGRLARLHALLPPLPRITPWREFYPPAGAPRGDVGLFLGCVTDVTERATLAAAVTLLTRLGYGVQVPRAQTCCGALHRHRGDLQTAQAYAQRNVAAFGDRPLAAVVSVASGCGATLAEYGRGADGLAAPLHDISDFLALAPWPAELRCAPLPKRIAVHDPCSLSHVLRQHRAPYRLLARIPDIELVPLPDNGRCCGAAGSYILSEPAFADALRDEKIAALAAMRADILVTSNVGCALHLRAGIAAAGLNIAVMHPVELLARQLAGAESSTLRTSLEDVGSPLDAAPLAGRERGEGIDATSRFSLIRPSAGERERT